MTLQVLRLGPYGQRKVMLPRECYIVMTKFIISAFESRSQISFEYLLHKAQCAGLTEQNGFSPWHLLMVKQDLETRRIIKIRFTIHHPKTQILCLNRRALKDLDFV
jgi:hypothetical protein